ncbi:MAG: amidohydrolase [Deltaproteobacteria bacterium]|nr:amidohydrolase [Deltaproteobacteria bacterium]
MLLRTNRKSVLEEDDGGLPIPTQWVSNGEFTPPPQSESQRKLGELVREMADERARKLGMSRRSFLQTSAGMATALMAINIVNGCGSSDPVTGGFAVDDCATRDPAAARELFESDYFIMDVQTHHVDLDGAAGTGPLADALQDFFAPFRICNPDAVANGSCTRGDIMELSQANYIKEMFLDSETAVAMMSGLPAPQADLAVISNAGMARTRDVGDQLGASQRMLTQGMLTPNFRESADTDTRIQDMEYLVNELGIRALKTYTGAGGFGFFVNVPPWELDDEAIAYPMYAEAERLGIDIVNAHKGLQLGVFHPDYLHPRDFVKAAKDWPNMNFVCYHSAAGVLDDWVAIKRNQLAQERNVYTELGAVFAGAVSSDNAIDQIGHLLGKLVGAFGADRILWGTDSIWYGSPQWQINALKTFQMPQRLMDEFGYPEITTDIKRQIFGLNAARLYKVDVDEVRCTLPSDPLTQARAEYLNDAQPSLRTYGPKTRREFLQLAFGGREPDRFGRV